MVLLLEEIHFLNVVYSYNDILAVFIKYVHAYFLISQRI